MRSKTKKLLAAGATVAAAVTTALRFGAASPAIEPVAFNPPPVPTSQIGKHPNILLVIADDFGKDADPCHPGIGKEKPSMPNLEAICESGVVFENVWTDPVCSPTRATMMTGLYGFRTGVVDVDDPLDPDTRSLADELAAAPVPYANAFIGKWHLSGGADADPMSPAGLGVQHFAGFLSGGVKNYFRYQMVEDGVKRAENRYATTVFSDEAVSWLAEQKTKDDNRPWFLWLAYNAPHAPFHLPPANLRADQSLSGEASDIEENPRPYYFAALEGLDRELGRVLASLPADERANTTIIFVGDNGTPAEVTQPPYDAAAAKGSVYQGGVWGVLAVSGAGVTRRGEREDAPVNSTDIFATVAELGGSTLPAPEDSVSFADALVSKNFTGRRYAFTEYERGFAPRQWAIRDARYKLVVRGGAEELYDLVADPYEARDLLAGTPTAESLAKVAELRAQEETLRAMN